MKKSLVIILLALCAVTPVLKAQSLWTSAEVRVKAPKTLNGFVEAEFRTHDGISSAERWAGTVGLDYKLFSFLKATAGYTYIHQQTVTETTKKGNIIPSYWQPKHRASFALTGSVDWKRFSFSLRERYQYTYRTGQSVPKFDSDGITPKDDEIVEAKHKHVLRSRLEVEYNIAKSKFTPYVSCELYNSLSDSFAVEKTRWTIGSSYKINKKNSVSLYYRYIANGDEDEEGGHVIGVGYKFNL